MRKIKNLEARSSELGASMSAPSSVILVLILSLGFCVPSYAADKNWTGEGDGTDWFDDANWLPDGNPEASDNAKVDLSAARVDVDQTFDAKSLTIGGKKDSVISVSNFVTGELSPGSSTDDSAIVRRDGKLILKGSAGKLTLKGSYKDSEELIPDEPSFLLYVK